MSIRVLIAEDYQPIRLALRCCLEANADIEIVGEAADGREAVRQCLQWKPDVVTMDIRMPGVDGIQATGQIRRLLPQVAVLAVSSEAELWTVQQMFAAGASGYILKDFLGEDLEAAVRTLACGHAFLGRQVMDEVLTYGINRGDALAPGAAAVLRNLAQGESRAQSTTGPCVAPDAIRQTLCSPGQSAGTLANRGLASQVETR